MDTPSVQQLVNMWRELGEEMQRVIEAMTPEQRDDLLPDWFTPRLEAALSSASRLACRQCGEPLYADGEGGWTCAKRFEHPGAKADTPSVQQLVDKWRGREQELCRKSDNSKSGMLAERLAFGASQIGKCADELDAALSSASRSPQEQEQKDTRVDSQCDSESVLPQRAEG